MARQFLADNPDQNCMDFSALAPLMTFTDSDEVLAQIRQYEIDNMPRPPIPPFQIPRNEFFSLASDYDVGFAAGSQFNGPLAVESMFNMAAGLIASVAKSEALACAEPEASQRVAAIIDLIEQAKTAGEVRDPPFLTSCEENSRFENNRTCDCIAQVTLAVMPEVYTRSYNDALLVETNSRNPFLLAYAMGGVCLASRLGRL